MHPTAEKHAAELDSELSLDSGRTSAARRRAQLKLDFGLLLPVTIIYWLNFLDRSNIGNARTAGLQKDLALTNTQYSIALTVTYVPYILIELPLTLALKRIGPHILLPTLVCLWGIVTTFQGFVTSFGGLVAARFFLGMTEGAILPGSILYLSSFYPRAALGKRIAFFFSATSLAGAFSGLLAAAIVQMNGIRHRPGWSWLFILEGILTVVYGCVAFFILPRDLASAKLLSAEEKEIMHAALQEDGHTDEEQQPFSFATVLSALKSLQVWLLFLQFFSSGAMLYGLAYFTPTIVQAIGYKTVTSIQLHSVPPYVCSTATSIGISLLSDRIRQRGIFVMLMTAIAVAGYAMYLTSRNPDVLYASLFLQIIGTYTVAALQSTWMPNNLAPYYKRATGITMGFISTNSGGILSTWLFPTTEGPRFHRGTSVLLGLSCSMFVFAGLNTAYLTYQNKKKESMLERGTKADYSHLQGDERPDFKYVP